jgi:hypothetical protein
MLKHVITWRLKAEDEPTKLEQGAQIASLLEGLVPLIPSLNSLTVGSNVVAGNWDLCLIAEFADEAGLDAYQVHPEHQKVVGVIKGYFAERGCVDFLI